MANEVTSIIVATLQPAVWLGGKAAALARWLTAWFGTYQGRRAAVLGSVALFPFITVAIWWIRQDSEAGQYSLDDALHLLDEGEWASARFVANHLVATRTVARDEWGGPFFVQGASIARESTTLWGDDARRRQLEAAAFLRAARQVGLPPGREAECTFMLGKSLYQGGLHDMGRAVLLEALEHEQPHATVIHDMLSQSYLEDADPNYSAADRHNNSFLSGDDLTPEQRRRGHLRKCRILFEHRELADCRELLGNLVKEGGWEDELALLNAQILIADAVRLRDISPELSQEWQGKLNEVIEQLTNLQTTDDTRLNINGQSRLLIGKCLNELGQKPAALAHLDKTSEIYREQEAGIAAALEAADLAMQLGDPARAVTLYSRALESAPRPRSFQNRWLSLSSFRHRTLTAYQSLVQKAEYELAVSLASELDHIFPQVVRYERMAEAYRVWAETQSGTPAADLALTGLDVESSRPAWRNAGIAYARLARIRFATHFYPEDIWNGATSFLRAGEYSSAGRMFEEYIRTDSRRRRPEALVYLAQSKLAMGLIDEALVSLDRFFAYSPRHASIYEARVLASRAHRENESIDASKELLFKNYHDPVLRPESTAWRESLYALGDLLYHEGTSLFAKAMAMPSEGSSERIQTMEEAADVLRQAIEKLDEAIRRWPDDKRSVEPIYLMADAHWKMARLPKEKMSLVSVETTRLALQQDFQEHMQSAAEGYDRVQSRLNQILDEEGVLSDSHAAILRNCYFAAGAVLFEFGKYDSAATAYSSAGNRYQDRPEAIDAFVQLASCLMRLGREAEALGALEQAKVVLDGFPNDAPFHETSIFSAEEWTKELDWLINQYQSQALN